MTRRFCVGGNWKLNGDKASIKTICANLSTGPLDPNTEVVIGVPATHIEYTRSLLPATIGVAGQVSYSEQMQLPSVADQTHHFFAFFLYRMPGKYQAVLSPVKCRPLY